MLVEAAQVLPQIALDRRPSVSESLATRNPIPAWPQNSFCEPRGRDMRCFSRFGSQACGHYS